MNGSELSLVADGLLIAAALTAGVYCHVLAKRLRRLGDLDAGLGGAVAALSRQADELRRAMEASRKAAGEQTRELARRTARAEAAAGRLEILIAAMHDAESRAPRPMVRPSRAVAVPPEDAPEPDEAPETAFDEESPRPAPAAQPPEPKDDLTEAIRALARRRG